MITWVEKDILARSSRPGYPSKKVEKITVDLFIQALKKEGIKSILCFLDSRQLGYYKAIPSGLIHYYRQNGFDIAHLPIADHGVPPISAQEAKVAIRLFYDLPRPVLVHCSAGVDRTGAFVDELKLTEDRRLTLTAGVFEFMLLHSQIRGRSHFTKVTDLSQSIFELVKGSAHLSKADRTLLTHAALLHDIGTVRASNSHAWLGAQIVVDKISSICGVDYAHDIAQIVSLHGINENPEHEDACRAEGEICEFIGPLYRNVFPDGKRVVSKRLATLAGILRVADGYDYSLASETSCISLVDGLMHAEFANDKDRRRAKQKSALLHACTGIRVEE